MELDWAHLEPLTLGPVEQNGSTYHFSTNLPSRVGKHAIFVIWQRIDPAGEGFYSLSDVDFGSCAADLNLDGVVDGGDMGLLLSAWDTPEADLDGDDVTNGSDLGLLLSAWGSCAPDCDNDGTPDHEEIDAGAPDCNRDGVPDQCQTQEDCDDDGVWDLCAIAEGVVEDCNSNMIPDICELATPGADENGDGILDSCQLDGFTFGWAVDDQWDGGFNGSLSIHNDTDDCLSEWEVLFSTDGFTVETAWNGQLVPSEEGGYRIVNETWNGSLCPGESVTIGIGCSGTPTVPYGVYINGSPVTEEP
jgi:hypothetical protein